MRRLNKTTRPAPPKRVPRILQKSFKGEVYGTEEIQ